MLEPQKKQYHYVLQASNECLPSHFFNLKSDENIYVNFNIKN